MLIIPGPRFFLWCALVLVLASDVRASDATLLRYDQPARRWTEALPVGNGRLAAMVFGGIGTEQLQLNEGTLWSGGPRDWNNPGAKAALTEVRAALFAGDYVRATELSRKMQGLYTESYQPMGSLRLVFGHDTAPANAYRRTLDLARAVTAVSYEQRGIRFERQVFSSFPDQVIVVRIGASKPGQVNLSVGGDSLLRHAVETDGKRTLIVRGRAPSHVVPSYLRSERPVVYDEGLNAEGMRFEYRVRVVAKGGAVEPGGATLAVSKADEVLLLIAASTSFVGPMKSAARETGDLAPAIVERLDAAEQRGFAELEHRHLADHQALFGRVTLELGHEPDVGSLTTPQRLVRFAEGSRDPALATLLFNYGRYLLLGSSRPGGTPANLQGIWNDQVRPPWSSNYTLNINAEMNYWPAEVANLAECHEPLFDFIAALARNGRKTAEVNYGARGWVAHHNSDLWAHTSAVGNHGGGDPVWANWQMGGAWLSTHLWEHYAFSGDTVFLRERAWPLMKGAAEFCLDWLVPDAQGRLVTAPSTSPEIGFHTPDGRRASVAIGATMDQSIIWELFTNVLEAAGELGIDDAFTRQVAEARAKLLPPRVGSRGQLQEWADDLEELDPKHRHTSHLFGVYPGRQITAAAPEWFAAARRSLDLRGDESTGWALGWRINLWARFRDGERAYVFVRNLLRPVGLEETNYAAGGGVYPNLFDAHPPFQIDGNFAFTAGVCEMLVQSHLAEIELLPALPSAWPTGSVRGLRARGGFELDLTWADGRLTGATVRSSLGRRLTLKAGDRTIEQPTTAGGEYRFDGGLRTLTVP